MNETEARARRVLHEAVERRVFPGAVAEVGSSDGVLWREACGRLEFDADAAETTARTIFDLASLTKPLATTSVVFSLLERGALRLTDSPATCVPEWAGDQRSHVTIQHLLEHASGLSARLVDQPPDTRREFEHDICALPLEYAPGTQAIYSDLGFILLGFCAEAVGGASLANQTTALFAPLFGDATDDECLLLPFVPPALLPLTAPTRALPEDVRRRGQRLRGQVHDNYAAALGGFAGHAGLFGTAPGVGRVARALLSALRGIEGVHPFTPTVVARMVTPSHVPGSSRALGWDTMRPTSSCGRYLSARAFGHVGFTGTSIWLDPAIDRYFVLLTNRVCDGGSSDEMQTVRRDFHEALTAPSAR